MLLVRGNARIGMAYRNNGWPSCLFGDSRRSRGRVHLAGKLATNGYQWNSGDRWTVPIGRGYLRGDTFEVLLDQGSVRL